MRFFYYDKINRAPVLSDHVDIYEIESQIFRYMKIYDLGGINDGTGSSNSPYNFYIEEWRDDRNRIMKVATIYKPNSEAAKWTREEAANTNHFELKYLVSLEVPTDEFENMIRDFKVEPIII